MTPPPDSARIAAAAARLLDARRTGSLFNSLDPVAPESIAESYAIADAVAAEVAEPVVGWKIGCTSEFAQKALGLDQPMSGRVHDLRRAEGAEPISIAVRPGAQLEGEFAFTFAADLNPADAPFTQADIAAAISTLHPAIEVVGGRAEDFMTGPVLTTIADSGANYCLAIGPGVSEWSPDDLPTAAASMNVAGEVTGSGTGADVLGHPLDAVTWLANHLAERNLGLRAGDVVTSGTCTQITAATPGIEVTAEFGPYGSVTIALTSE